MDERVLTERLVTYDTSTAEGLHAAAGFVKGWLEARDIDVEAHRFGDLHALTAAVGVGGDKIVPTVVFHGHLDVVPGHTGQFVPRIERVTSEDVPMPYAKNLEDEVQPQVKDVVAAVRRVLYLE